MSMIKSSLIVVAACMFSLAGAASADTIAMNYTSPGATDVWGPLTIGWEFTVGSQPITVTSLGLQEQATLGLGVFNHDREVAIFNVAGSSKVASAIVLATDDNQGTNWKWHALDTAVVLDANTVYRIGAVATSNPTERYNYGATGITSGDGSISIGSSGYYTATGSLSAAYPANPTGFDTLPNFQYVVPEPATLALMFAGGWSVISRRRA